MSFWVSWKLLVVILVVLGVILAIWEAPGNHFGRLGKPCESFWLSERLLESLWLSWGALVNYFIQFGWLGDL